MNATGRSLILAGFAVAIWLGSSVASAHRIGLSQGDYEVRGGQVVSELTFATGELAEGAGTLSPDTERALRGRAAQVVERMRVTAGGERCPGSLEWIEAAAPDAVGVHVRHDCSALKGPLRLSLGFFELFERGHRHIAHVRRSGGTTETIAYAEQPDVFLGDVGPSGAGGAFGAYVRLGVEHILGGADHLLFLLGVVLLPAALRSTVLAVTAFTVAHSVTLSAAALGLVAPSPRFVEPLIALSVAYVGLENLLRKDVPRRYLLTFGFGLLHGFGFAGALAEISIPRAELPSALFGFNVGVELGQLLAVVPALLVLAWARRFEWFGRWTAPAVNVVIVALGLVWAGGRLTEGVPSAVAVTATPAPTAAAPATSRATPEDRPTERSSYPPVPSDVPELVERVCRAFNELPRKRRAECAGTTPGVTLEGECRRMLAFALRSGAVLVDPAAVGPCLADWERRYEGCEWTKEASLPPVPSCASVVAGRVELGAPCRSSLECRTGLHCDGVGPMDTGTCRTSKADGESCGLSVDPLGSYLPSALSAAHPECAGSCVNSRCRAAERPPGRSRPVYDAPAGAPRQVRSALPDGHFDDRYSKMRP